MFVSRMIPLVALVLLLPMPSISAPISATTTRDASPALPTSTPQAIAEVQAVVNCTYPLVRSLRNLEDFVAMSSNTDIVMLAEDAINSAFAFRNQTVEIISQFQEGDSPDQFIDPTNAFVTEVNQARSDAISIIDDINNENPNPDPAMPLITLMQAVVSTMNVCLVAGQTAVDGIVALEGLTLAPAAPTSR